MSAPLKRNEDRNFIRDILTELGSGHLFPIVIIEPIFISEPSKSTKERIAALFCVSPIAPLHSFSSSSYPPDGVLSAVRNGLVVVLLWHKNKIFYYIVSPSELSKSTSSLLDLINFTISSIDATSVSDNPSSEKNTKLILRPGRPRITEKNAEFLQYLAEYFGNSSVDPRLHVDILFKDTNSSLNKCLLFLETAMGEGSVIPSRSCIYNYLMPRRRGTMESRRHHDVALNVRPVLPSRDGNNIFRVDAHFCNSQNAALRSLFYLFGHFGIILSRDDKARIFIFGSATRRPTKTWVNEQMAAGAKLGVSAPSHDFQQIKELSLTLTCTLNLRLDTPANHLRKAGPLSQNGGKCVFYLKGTISTPSTARHHLDALLHQMEANAFELDTSVPFASSMLLFVDGGGDETMVFHSNRFLFVMLLMLLCLDVLVVAKYEPNGGSKKNMCERCHAGSSSLLSGEPIISDEFASKFLSGSVAEEKGESRVAVAAKQIVKIGLARTQKRLSTPGSTFSGLPITTSIWERDDDAFIFLPDNVTEVLAALQRSRWSVERAKMQETKMLVPERMKSLQRRLKVTPLDHIYVRDVVVFLQSTDHHVLGTHAALFAKCLKSSCLSPTCNKGVPRASASSPLFQLLGRSSPLKRLVELVHPQAHGHHYLALKDKLSMPIELKTDTSVCDLVAPSAHVKKFLASVIANGCESVSDSRFLNGLTALAEAHCFGSGSGEAAVFRRYVRDTFSILLAKKQASRR
jgi:hypothetical protein